VSGKNPTSLRRILVVAWVTLVISAVAGLAWTNRSLAREFQSSFRWVSHTQEVLQCLEETISLLKDVETGQRGFALTGEVAYLEPYHHALATIPDTLDDLLYLTADNPKQQAHILELRRLIDERIAIAEEFVAAREQDGDDAVTTLTKSGRGRASMESVRVLAEELKRQEKRLLKERKLAADESLFRQQIFGIAMLGLLTISSTIVFWMRRRITDIEEELVRICAWTNQVHHNGQWMAVETFLLQRFGLKTSHGMSEKAAKEFREEIGLPNSPIGGID